MKPMTPWGAADQATKHGNDGIVSYSTPSHGGFFVPEPMLRSVPDLIKFKPWAGRC